MSNHEIADKIVHLLGGTPAVIAGGVKWRSIAGGCEMRMKSKRINHVVIKIVDLNVFSVEFFKGKEKVNRFDEVDAIDLYSVFIQETKVKLSL